VLGPPLFAFGTTQYPIFCNFRPDPVLRLIWKWKFGPVGVVLLYEQTNAKNRKSLSIAVFELLFLLSPTTLFFAIFDLNPFSDRPENENSAPKGSYFRTSKPMQKTASLYLLPFLSYDPPSRSYCTLYVNRFFAISDLNQCSDWSKNENSTP